LRDHGAAAVDDLLLKGSVTILDAAVEVKIDYYAVAGFTRCADSAIAIIFITLVTQVALNAFALDPLGHKGIRYENSFRYYWIPAVEFVTFAESIRDFSKAAVDDFLCKGGFAILLTAVEIKMDHYAVAGVTR